MSSADRRNRTGKAAAPALAQAKPSEGQSPAASEQPNSKAVSSSSQDRVNAWKAAVAAAVSTSLQWYGFFIYVTAASLVFDSTFFATNDPIVSALGSFATIAVGFIARPIGGAVAGHVGDKYGRKPVLVAATTLMGVSTVLIGSLWDTSVVWLAPLLLVTLRLCQGLAIGGQWGGAVLLVTEFAPAHRRGFFGSFSAVGIPLGVVLANGAFLCLTSTLSSEAFLHWGWRIPFWAGVLVLGAALAIQHYVEETPAFGDVEKALEGTPERRSPVIDVLLTSWRVIGTVAGTYVCGTVMFYVTLTVTLQFGTSTLGIARSDLLIFILIGASIMAAMTPPAAWLSDLFGRKLIYGLGIAMYVVWAFPMWLLIAASSPDRLWPIALAIIVALVTMAFTMGPSSALFAELFPPDVRLSGASLGNQGAAVIGGIAPFVTVALIDGQSANTWRVSLMIVVLGVLGLVCLTILPTALIQTPVLTTTPT